MTEAKVELGRYFFYDTRMSANGAQSCASCHIQSLAFTDGKPRGEGSTGRNKVHFFVCALSSRSVVWTCCNPSLAVGVEF
jgi:cytochrome c peroxidase